MAEPEPEPEQDWQARRREAAAAQAERAARAEAAETVKAQAMVAQFVADATAAGIVPEPLVVRAGDGSGTYRTPLTGWYLRRDGSIGVGQDGAWYQLVVRKSLRARLAGVSVDPVDPPLQVGKGARDGESIALDTLLALRLSAGNDWPIHR